MPNMSKVKVPMPEQAPDIRNKNFAEVTLGYTDKDALEEADRCLNCKHKPCMKGCPVNVQIPEFISAIKAGEFKKANDIIKETSSLPAVCGRVCPQESQCEKYCVRGIKNEPVGIGRLERFAADWAMENFAEKSQKPAANGHKVAVVGAGPAGLTCAGDLALMGYDVTIFEAFHVAGGVLMYGIPEFRLPKALVQKEINSLKELGVKIVTNFVVGKSETIDDLLADGYEAVFVGSGAGLPKFMNLPGENLNGVYSANEYLTRINLMKAYEDGAATPIYHAKNVAVFGGGNVAMDAARSAKRMGAENVYIVYRRSENELPARAEEVHHAKEEGIIFKILSNPNEIIGDENFWVKAIKCDTMELGEPDESGRRSPVKVPNAEFILDVDCVIVSIGTSPNPIIPSSTPDLTTNRWGCVVADDAGITEKPGVFAGGDVVTGAATVILAMGAGKNAAAAMDEYIKKR
ncbi:NADPH-dependent glutamate synthase [Candidatus Epulonipiscium viviparus]|uniref:NADPH-dependent glutamate synthase n=1 Tax=Candidatus Epulonipiscium viviparus TaxID=420336 RepID=UPI00016C0B4B|nr:NADPH-dependent glutamate synthase [Candidatus Epulopiscium viviparus]